MLCHDARHRTHFHAAIVEKEFAQRRAVVRARIHIGPKAWIIVVVVVRIVAAASILP